MNPSPEALQRAFSRLLATEPPELSNAALQTFVKPFFDRCGRYLQVADTHGSPLYLLDRAALRARARRLKAAFDGAGLPVDGYYAMKSNNHPEVSRTLIEAGFGLDVSSGLELEQALELKARRIVFSGPGKTDTELRLAAAHADEVTILLDSWGELQRLEAIAAAQRRRLCCGVRLTVDPTGLWRKFGIPLGELADFWLASRQCPHIRLAGLQFHSSWNLSPQPQIAFIASLGKTLAALPDDCLNDLEFIDIGGGYWPGQGEWLHPAATPFGRLNEALGYSLQGEGPHHCLPAASIETFAAHLGDAIRSHLAPVKPCRICIEPGRWLSHGAMHLLMTVVDKKAPDLVITDAGTNAIGWERFESDYFPVLNLSRPASTERACYILGSLCTPHDVWGYFYFGQAIEAGDILLVPCQGAYTYSLRQDFIKPLPDAVCLDADSTP